MAGLPSQHPDLSLHLTDSTLTPLITSSSSPSHLDSLTSLANTALSSHSAVSRANLGTPQRIMVEYPNHGAVVLQSYIDPQDTNHQQQQQQQQQQPPQGLPPPPTPSSRPATSHRHQNSRPQSRQVRRVANPATDPDEAPPRLVSVVVAGSADQTREARRAAAQLERIGRDIQKEWVSVGPGPETDNGAV